MERSILVNQQMPIALRICEQVVVCVLLLEDQAENWCDYMTAADGCKNNDDFHLLLTFAVICPRLGFQKDWILHMERKAPLITWWMFSILWGSTLFWKWAQIDSLIVSGYGMSCHFKKAIMSHHKTSGTHKESASLPLPLGVQSLRIPPWCLLGWLWAQQQTRNFRLIEVINDFWVIWREFQLFLLCHSKSHSEMMAPAHSQSTSVSFVPRCWHFILLHPN